MIIDWAYLRKNWTSCQKAQEVLEAKQIKITTVTDARKERFDANAAWDLIKSAIQITTAKGKKVVSWNPQVDDKEAILRDVMGPSGNLRAPAFQIQQEFIVGFNPELYAEKIK